MQSPGLSHPPPARGAAWRRQSPPPLGSHSLTCVAALPAASDQQRVSSLGPGALFAFSAKEVLWGCRPPPHGLVLTLVGGSLCRSHVLCPVMRNFDQGWACS